MRINLTIALLITGKGAVQAGRVTIHQKAIDKASNGNIADALYDFEAACTLSPQNAGFWSDLGVTQMRLGLLDEALVSFLNAEEINPGLKLVVENLEAMHSHLKHRSATAVIEAF